MRKARGNLRLWAWLFLAVALPPCFAAGDELVYKYQSGDKYRILSTVQEDVYVDFVQSHKAEILNRIAVEVTAASGGKGTLKAVFQTSERATGSAARNGGAGQSFQWSREYESEFERDSRGVITIDKKYFMPVVRDVPVFPGKNLNEGDKWSAAGHEVHDFSENFGIAEPYRIPFTAYYVYLGNREYKGKTYPAISVSYQVLAEPQAAAGRLWPKRITGASDQIIYWDTVLGQTAAYTEKFRMVFEMSNGRTLEYLGNAEAEIVESVRMDKEKIAEEISADISRLEIADVTVRVVDEGITISLDNIQFRADTAVMLSGEREKLDKIVDILLRYQERDILVSGHTALAGTVAGRQKLSLERAAVVANYLIAKKARPADRVVVRGYGAERPVDDSRTEEGMRKNRRVEITILEN